MTSVQRLTRPLALVLGALIGLVALTWALERVAPRPYAGYFAVIAIGLVATEIFKRRPRQRAIRMLRTYLKARERGAGEDEARRRLLVRMAGSRPDVAGQAQARWVGESEKARVLGGLAALLAAEQRSLDADVLVGLYDRARDQVVIDGWAALPEAFVDRLLGRLDDGQREQLDALAAKYALFRQRFFRGPSVLGHDPAAGVKAFARLLASMGNRVGPQVPGDAERAYRLSLALHPAGNLAHAGLALLLDRTGRNREAVVEARTALEILDDDMHGAADRSPAPEDIAPFSTPEKLREALQRVARGE